MTNLTPAILWDTACEKDCNLVFHLAKVSPFLDILVIPREILEDVTFERGASMREMADNIPHRIEAALAVAWAEGRRHQVLEPGKNVVRHVATVLDVADFR